MNYIFEILLKHVEEGKKYHTVSFKPAREYSAYLELARTFLNDLSIEEGDCVEINPYFRYHEVFKNLFVEEKNREKKEILMDLLLHISFECERYAGVYHERFYIEFIREECEQGNFGTYVQAVWNTLSLKEQRGIAKGILDAYFSGDFLDVLKEQVCCLFPKANIYLHNYQKKEILIYTAVKRTMERQDRINAICQLFLPLTYQVQIYWKNHFGIIDIKETMYLDQLELY